MTITNPNVDERRWDIGWNEATTPGEVRRIRYTVREKTLGVFANASSFATYTEWELYIFEKLGDGGATQATRQSASYFYVPAADFALAAPYAIPSCSEVQTALLEPGMRAHELWAKVNGDWSRLSFGDFPVSD